MDKEIQNNYYHFFLCDFNREEQCIQGLDKFCETCELFNIKDWKISYPVYKKLFEGSFKNELYVSNFGRSADNAFFLTFTNENKRLHIEIYDDGEIGYIIEDTVNRKTIDNKEIVLKDVIRLIKEFLEK